MRGRRVILVVAVVMGLMALAASVAPPPQRTGPDGGTTPAPGPQATTVTAQAGEVSRRLVVAGDGRARVRARVGQNVSIDVSGDVIDAVVIPGLGIVEPIDPGSPAQIQLYADAPGAYPIRLLDSGRPVGVLEISPAS